MCRPILKSVDPSQTGRRSGRTLSTGSKAASPSERMVTCHRLRLNGLRAGVPWAKMGLKKGYQQTMADLFYRFFAADIQPCR